MRFFRDMVKSFKVTHILDITTGCGLLGFALLLEGERETEYFGLCHTAEQVEVVNKYLTDRILIETCDESCKKLYNPLYAKYRGTKKKADDARGPSPEKSGKAAKAKGPKSGGKKRKRSNQKPENTNGTGADDDDNGSRGAAGSDANSGGSAASSPPVSDGDP